MGMLRRLSRLPLLWRVFGTNAAVLVLAFLGLVLAPVTVSVPPHATELIVLVVRLLVLLAINLLLLRPVLRPLDELADTMRRHDPLSPGARAEVGDDPDVAALARTFNEMLDRLESERRDSARRALLLQEGERRRIARELHDEVGQTLTGVMLQIEGLSAAVPEQLQDQLDELRETARHGTGGGAADRPPAAAQGARGPRTRERPHGARHGGRRPGRPARQSTRRRPPHAR